MHDTMEKVQKWLRQKFLNIFFVFLSIRIARSRDSSIKKDNSNRPKEDRRQRAEGEEEEEEEKTTTNG